MRNPFIYSSWDWGLFKYVLHLSHGIQVAIGLQKSWLMFDFKNVVYYTIFWVSLCLIDLKGWQQVGLNSTSWPNSFYHWFWMHSLFSSQHHGVTVKAVDIIMVPPGLLGIHTQSLTVHHLIQDLWGREKMKKVKRWGKVRRSMEWIQNIECSGGRKEMKEKEQEGAEKNEIDIDIYCNRKWEQWGNERQKEQWRKRMTKEESNKKVASGEHAFSSYDRPVWDTVRIKDMAEESFSKFFTRDLLF